MQEKKELNLEELEKVTGGSTGVEGQEDVHPPGTKHYIVEYREATYTGEVLPEQIKTHDVGWYASELDAKTAGYSWCSVNQVQFCKVRLADDNNTNNQ